MLLTTKVKELLETLLEETDDEGAQQHEAVE